MRFIPFFFTLSVLAAPPAGEFIYEKAPFPSCHASTIVELKSGELMSAWFGGKDEGAPDVAIWAARKPKDGGSWSAPIELARETNIATYNPVLFYTKDGRLWLYYKFGPSPDRWSAARKFSVDDGVTWSPTEYLPAGLLGPIRSKPLVMNNGAIVAGSSVESYHTWAAWIERSLDNGRTWTRFGPIVVPGKSDPSRTLGIIQPAVVSLGGNHLKFYARSTSQIGKIVVSDSTNGGATWTDARPLDLPNPNSGADAVALKDKRIVLVYNHTEKGRTPLNLAVSTDKDGEKFKMFLTLESEPGEFSYPAIIQGAGGDLHITYTWNRKKIKYVRVPLAGVR